MNAAKKPQTDIKEPRPLKGDLCINAICLNFKIINYKEWHVATTPLEPLGSDLGNTKKLQNIFCLFNLEHDVKLYLLFINEDKVKFTMPLNFFVGEFQDESNFILYFCW